MERSRARRQAFSVISLVVVGGMLASCAEPQSNPAPVTMVSPAGTSIAPPPRAAARPAPPHGPTITVQPGQQLGRIALLYHVPKKAIIEANHLQPPYELKAGARLTIPGGVAPDHVATAAPDRKPAPSRVAHNTSTKAHPEKAAKTPTKAPASEPEVIPLD